MFNLQAGWLAVLVFLPVFGALTVAILPPRAPGLAWRVSVLFACLVLLLSAYLCVQYDPQGPLIQFHESRAWNVRLGSYFALGVDGVSLAMVLLSALLTLVALLASRSLATGARLYFPLVLLLESAMLGVFMARDWSLFYVFWEATLIPLFFLIDRLGGENRQRAALNFFLYTLAGSVLMLVSLLFLYDAAPGHSFAMGDMAHGGQGLPKETQLLIFLGLLAGFAVKMPVVPLHGWLPLAHVEAPWPVSILLSGVLLKMGAYGLIRAIETLPAAFVSMQTVLFGFGLFSVFYGAVLAWRQQDLKAMVAYSSVSHMGLVLVGLATLDVAGFQGACYQMVAHGLSAALLFLVVGLLYERMHQRDLSVCAGMHRYAPRLAANWQLALLAGVGLPGSAGFIAEVHILQGVLQHQAWGAVILLSAMLVSVAAALRVIGQLGLPVVVHQAVPDIRRTEWGALLLLLLPMLVLGMWPSLLTDFWPNTWDALRVVLGRGV